MARGVVHLFPHLWGRVTGAHAGPVELTVGRARFRYLLGPQDPIGDILYWQGSRNWESEVIPVYQDLVRQAKGYVLDIGANFGVYTLQACALHPSVRVIAWEPVPFVYERLGQNVGANGFEARVECRQRALAETAGSATFYMHPDSTMGSLSNAEGVGTPIQVSIEAADDVVNPEIPVDLIKIDVEGHELPAFRGMGRILGSHHPPIIFECLNAGLWEPLAEYLTRHKYRFFRLTSAGPQPITQFHPETTNYLARR